MTATPGVWMFVCMLDVVYRLAVPRYYNSSCYSEYTRCVLFYLFFSHFDPYFSTGSLPLSIRINDTKQMDKKLNRMRWRIFSYFFLYYAKRKCMALKLWKCAIVRLLCRLASHRIGKWNVMVKNGCLNETENVQHQDIWCDIMFVCVFFFWVNKILLFDDYVFMRVWVSE